MVPLTKGTFLVLPQNLDKPWKPRIDSKAKKPRNTLSLKNYKKNPELKKKSLKSLNLWIK